MQSAYLSPQPLYPHHVSLATALQVIAPAMGKATKEVTNIIRGGRTQHSHILHLALTVQHPHLLLPQSGAVREWVLTLLVQKAQTATETARRSLTAAPTFLSPLPSSMSDEVRVLA